MSEWIKVSDRVPEEGQTVLYYFHYVGIHIGKYGSYVDEDGKHDLFYGKDGWLSDDVTHWMPLPQPPK